MEHSWSAGIWPLAQPPQAPLTAAAPVLGAGALQLAAPVPVTGSAVGVVGGTVTRTAVLRSGSSRTATCQRSAEAEITLVPPTYRPTSSSPVSGSVLKTRSPICNWP